MRLNQIVSEAIYDTELRHLLRPQDDFESDEDYAIRQRQGAAKVSQARRAAELEAGDFELRSLSNDELEAELSRPLTDDGISLDDTALDDGEEAKQREKRAAEERRLAKERELAAEAEKIKAFSGTIARGVANALNEKIKGTLARLKANPKTTPEYYNRANVNLRGYVVDIAKRWQSFSAMLVSEAAVHDLGSIYQALLDYSYKVVTKMIVDNGIKPEAAERFVTKFKNHNAGILQSNAFYSGSSGQPGERVDAVTWIKRLPVNLLRQLDSDYRKRNETYERHPLLHVAASKAGEFDMKDPDTRAYVKQLVDEVYQFVRRKNAERTMKKRRGG